jgi:glycosyltransferase involved in cell wall biosynthesis
MTGSRRPRVGLMATHPIQYYVPWYRALSDLVDLQVFYCQRQTPQGQAAAGFGVAFDWDVPLVGGYQHRFLRNRTRRPNVSTFLGCDTPEIASIIRRERFDAFIVHGWATRSYWQAMLASWQTRTPLLVRGDSHLQTPVSAARRAIKDLVYTRFIPRFDGYLVVGRRARQYYLHYGADPRRMFATPHAVDNAFFEAEAARLRGDRARLRREVGLPEEAVVWLFAGKLVDRKRPADFVRAVGQADGVWGLVVGDGPLRAELESRVSQQGSPVRFAGFLNQTQIPAAYAASDGLVLPSDGSETWGLVVNEAMASGLPAIVSDEVGCGPDLVRGGETGEVFCRGDVDHLARLLTAHSANRERLAALGRRAQRHIQNYSIEAAANGTVAAIEAVGGRRGTVRRAA